MERRALLGLALVATAAASASPEPAAASSSKEGGGASAETYFRLPVVTASIAGLAGRRGVLSIETGLDVPDAALRLRAQQSAPRLRAAYNTAAQQFAAGLRPGGELLSGGVIGGALQAATNATLGRPGARLLLGTVMAI